MSEFTEGYKRAQVETIIQTSERLYPRLSREELSVLVYLQLKELGNDQDWVLLMMGEYFRNVQLYKRLIEPQPEPQPKEDTKQQIAAALAVFGTECQAKQSLHIPLKQSESNHVDLMQAARAQASWISYDHAMIAVCWDGLDDELKNLDTLDNVLLDITPGTLFLRNLCLKAEEINVREIVFYYET